MGRGVRVLLVEDDEYVRLAVRTELTQAGYQVTAVGDLAGAHRALLAGGHACAVFDRMLPDGDALHYVASQRAVGLTVPVLMLTARDSVNDRVAGFAAGADDYLVKPFSMPELTARVAILAGLGRAGRPTILRYTDLEMDCARRETRRAGVLLTLSGKEFAVLEYLMLRPEHAVPRADLIEHCWDEDSDPSANVVDRVITRLRAKLHEPNLIHAVRGTGYRLASTP